MLTPLVHVIATATLFALTLPVLAGEVPAESFLSGTYDITLRRCPVVGFCKPEHATIEQMTDVFCAYLRDTPAKRDGLPSIMLNDALKTAWPCPGK